MTNQLIDDNKNNIKKFLKINNLEKYKLIKIKQDASSRKYYRIKNKNIILMESIQNENKNKEFVKLSNYLNSINFSAPKVLVKNHNKGLYLIEDFGNYTFKNAIKEKIKEETLYLNAIEVLAKLQNYKSFPNIPRYNYNNYFKELNIFIEWYFKEININLSKEALNKWGILWKKALKQIIDDSKILVLRDFHAENLFWLPKRKNIKKIGLIDFQDALIGHITYDISSLLEDVRRKVSLKTKNAALKKFIKLKKIKDKNLFYKNYYTIAAQRNAKIVGIFIRLARRDKKYKYLKLVNRAMKIFISSLHKANQNDLLNWINTNIPQEKIKIKNEKIRK